MKDKSNLKSTVSAPPGSAAAPANAAKKPPENRVLTVPECDSPAELEKFCDELLAALAKKPNRLTLRFIGLHHMSPDAALNVFEILNTRGSGVALTTDTWSPLLGPSILVWLAGHERRIRATTNLQFRSLREILLRHKKSCPPWEDNFDALPGDVEAEATIWSTDYKTVLRLMNQYLPVDELADQIITPEMLKELGLVETGPLDELLRKCLAEAAPSAPAVTPKESEATGEGTTQSTRPGHPGAKQ